MAKSKLTTKQRRFVDEYLVDHNATQAAIRAGYSAKTASETAYENIRKPQIEIAIQEALQKQQARTEITADWTLKEIYRLASFDPRKMYDENGNLKKIADMDDDTAACIGGIDVQESPLGEVTKKFKIWDKNTALGNLAKHFKLLVDRLEASGPGGGPIEQTITNFPPTSSNLAEWIEQMKKVDAINKPNKA